MNDSYRDDPANWDEEESYRHRCVECGSVIAGYFDQEICNNCIKNLNKNKNEISKRPASTIHHGN